MGNEIPDAGRERVEKPVISAISRAYMYFSGRWVPMDVMDVIITLWGVAAIIILGVLLWGCRTPTTKSDTNEERRRQEKKRGRRKRR